MLLMFKLVPRLSPAHPLTLQFTYANIMHKKLKERIKEPGKEPCLPGCGWSRTEIREGHRWVRFCIRLSLSFKLSCIIIIIRMSNILRKEEGEPGNEDTMG